LNFTDLKPLSKPLHNFLNSTFSTPVKGFSPIVQPQRTLAQSPKFNARNLELSRNNENSSSFSTERVKFGR
jgi:hypothetical protein